MKITREYFTAMTGQAPSMDDLERCNCPMAGEIGHYYCGWCHTCDKPRWVCGHPRINADDEYESRMALPGSLDDYQEGGE
jgi:hypothetical protein